MYVSWVEDAQQTRDRTAARNVALLRKITLNLARQAPQPGSKRLSLKSGRNLAAWERACRHRLLGLAWEPVQCLRSSNATKAGTIIC